MRSACSLSAGRSAALAPLLQICVASRPCVQLLRAFCFFPQRVLRGDDRDYHRLFGFHRRASSPSCVHIAYYKCRKFSLYFTAHGSHLRPPKVAPPTYNPAGNETSPLQVQPAGVEFPELDDTTFACNCCPIEQKLPNLQLPPQVITFRKHTEN